MAMRPSHTSSTDAVIVLTEPFEPSAVDRLRQHAQVTLFGSSSDNGVRLAIQRAHALLVRHRTMVTRDLIDSAPLLRVIGRGGVGLDNVNVDYAGERGIAVVHTPEAVTTAVAQHTVALLLATEHRLASAYQAFRSPAQFELFRDAIRFRELHDCVLGVIGIGRIGSAVARACSRGFNMPVLYNDIRDVQPLDFPARSASKEYIYAHADIITLHVPLTCKTHRMLDMTAITAMRSSTVLINTSRGAVVDQHAVARALMDGRLAAAALDVFDSEPLSPDDDLLRAPNLLLTPHIAAHSSLGLEQISCSVVDDVLAVLHGRAPRYPAPRATDHAGPLDMT